VVIPKAGLRNRGCRSSNRLAKRRGFSFSIILSLSLRAWAWAITTRCFQHRFEHREWSLTLRCLSGRLKIRVKARNPIRDIERSSASRTYRSRRTFECCSDAQAAPLSFAENGERDALSSSHEGCDAYASLRRPFIKNRKARGSNREYLTLDHRRRDPIRSRQTKFGRVAGFLMNLDPDQFQAAILIHMHFMLSLLEREREPPRHVPWGTATWRSFPSSELAGQRPRANNASSATNRENRGC